MAQRVDTAEAARALAMELQRHGRTKPAVVVSIAGGLTAPFVDVETLERELDGLCDVYVLPTGEASWAYAKALPDGRQVYGGASRVYSTDLDWVADQYASPLRFAYSSADGRVVTEQLVADALTAVYRHRQASPRVATGRVERSGTVRAVVAGRALVELDSGGAPFPATVHPELVAPGVAVERMFAKAQHVTGLYDAEANRLDVGASALQPSAAFAEVQPNDVLLALVTKLGTKYATVRLLPGVEVRVPLEEFGEDDPGIGHLVTVGEILPVEVTEIVGGLPCRVEVRPSNFADLARPVAILPGGPAWLTAEQVAALAPTEATAGHAVGVNGSAEDDAIIDPTDPAAPLLAEIAGLRRRLRATEAEVKVLEQQLAAAKTSARTRKEELRTTRDELAMARSHRASTRRDLFEDPAHQFRHEVYVEWAERTTAQDKATRPWREPAIGPAFLDTMDTTEGVDRSKVVEVVADIISGQAEHLPGRALHRLRRGNGANDPVVTREDGATCWRIYLQHKSPSARRLHFWRLPDGSIELSSVRLHDDNRP